MRGRREIGSKTGVDYKTVGASCRCTQAGGEIPHLEKATYGFAVIALFVAGRASGQVLAFGLIDLAIGVLFVVAYVQTAGSTSPAGRST